MENLKTNEEILEKAIKIGIQEGMRYIVEQENNVLKNRYDKRLRNTRLLLKNYRNFIIHFNYSQEIIKDVTDENAVDVLDKLDSINSEELYIASIKRTKTRTKIIINHINKCLEYYKVICSSSEISQRRYNIIKKLYIEFEDNNKFGIPTYEKLADELYISTKTIKRHVNKAIEELSTLLFGIDGVNLKEFYGYKIDF